MIWHANLYDTKHGFVSKYGEDVIALLAPAAGEQIIDIGCGTGELANLIYEKGATVMGIDNSPEMIATAKAKFPHIKFDVKSATEFSYEQTFDAVFSNATLHWVLDYKQAIEQVHKALKTGGRFVAEFGGKGNVDCIVQALKTALRNNGFNELAEKQVWYFPSLAEYSLLLEQHGFRVVFAAHFDRPTQLQDDDGIRNWLSMFAQPYLSGLSTDEIHNIMQQVETQIRPQLYKNGHWYADYVRLRIAAVKMQ